jgi:hypothetical protein
MTGQIERKVIDLISADRIEIPLSSIEQKVRRTRAALASEIAEYCSGNVRFAGKRVYAFTESEDKERARGMKEAVAEFVQEHPKYGKILQGKIAQKRKVREQHLYFGLNTDSRLTTEDYLDVMRDVGLTETQARALYGPLMNVSRQLARARTQERSIIVG